MKIKKKMLPIIASALAVFTMTFSITASAARNHTYTTNLELIENTNISDSLQSAKVSTYGLTERIPIRILDCSTNNYTDSTFNSIFMDTEMESYSPSYFPTYRKSNISTMLLLEMITEPPLVILKLHYIAPLAI